MVSELTPTSSARAWSGFATANKIERPVKIVSCICFMVSFCGIRMRIDLRRRVSPRYEELANLRRRLSDAAWTRAAYVQVAFYQWRRSLTKPAKLGGVGPAIL